MIRLFRLDGLELMLNVDMIKEIKPGPPLAITLLNGDTIQVKNTMTDVVTKIKAYRKGINDENYEFDPEARKKHDRGRKPPGR
jgi:uncharacterized protein YlzI (FlbEa/FlbD family)